jgi:ABC-type antimicrobial peptide transport system permease subunit
MQLLKNELTEIPNVQQVSFCMEAPASQHFNTLSITYDNRPKEELWSLVSKPADDQYISTFNLKLLAGRNMYASDTINQYIVNETVIKKLGLKSPQEIINKNITVDGKTAPVVGVVKDFYNNSFHSDIAPVVFFPAYYNYENCAVKIGWQNMQSTLAAMEKTWNSVYPQYVYNKEFLDDRIAHFYALDNIMLKLVEFFAGIAILIGCLGLYGLVSFMALQKTKEIGVRKVLGASLQNILWLFGKEFSSLLIIAFFIAAPTGWWLMNKYLQDFKYRIQIGAGVFVLAILITFIIASLTIGYRSIKAAIANPVTSLRTE